MRARRRKHACRPPQACAPTQPDRCTQPRGPSATTQVAHSLQNLIYERWRGIVSDGTWLCTLKAVVLSLSNGRRRGWRSHYKRRLTRSTGRLHTWGRRGYGGIVYVVGGRREFNRTATKHAMHLNESVVVTSVWVNDTHVSRECRVSLAAPF